MSGFFPPTPAPSFEYVSPRRRPPPSVTTSPNSKTRVPIGPPAFLLSSGSRPSYHSVAERNLPPTPPVNDAFSSEPPFDAEPTTSGLSFAEPEVPQRKRRGRRPASVYPAPGEPSLYRPQRKYTDPTPRTQKYVEAENEETSDNQQLDVDLDVYSTTEYEGEGLEDREPTLSFVTTSTLESTASTPSMGISYGFREDTEDGKPAAEPRIRMRTTAGRTNAYSSAESSTASGVYPYPAYPETHIFHPHPPPLPIVPNAYALPAEHIGLGITGHDIVIPARQRDSQIVSPIARPPLSPSDSFVHRPWRRDVVNRLRSDSASSSLTTASASTSDTVASASGVSGLDYAAVYPHHVYQYTDRLSWEPETQTETRSEAVAMVDEGRGKILDMEKLNEMGGLQALTEEKIGSLGGMYLFSALDTPAHVRRHHSSPATKLWIQSLTRPTQSISRSCTFPRRPRRFGQRPQLPSLRRTGLYSAGGAQRVWKPSSTPSSLDRRARQSPNAGS